MNTHIYNLIYRRCKCEVYFLTNKTDR